MKPFYDSEQDRPVTVVSEISQTWTNFEQAGKKLTCSNTTKRVLFCNILFFSNSGSHAQPALKDGKSAWKIQ